MLLPVLYNYNEHFYFYLDAATTAQQQTIYEYHRVEIDITKITNYSAVEFIALPCKWKKDRC